MDWGICGIGLQPPNPRGLDRSGRPGSVSAQPFHGPDGESGPGRAARLPRKSARRTRLSPHPRAGRGRFRAGRRAAPPIAGVRYAPRERARTCHAQVPERSAGRILSPPAPGTGTRCGPAQSRQDHAPGPVLTDHPPRVEGVRAPVVDAVREQQHGRREAVTSDLRSIPRPHPGPVPRAERRTPASPCRAAPGRAGRAHTAMKGMRSPGCSRLLEGSGQVARP